MTFPVAAGASNNSSTGPNKFIPQIWTGKLVKKFYATTVFGEIANTDYEGEIKEQGDTVVIRTVPSITIHNYVKGQTLQYQQPESPNVDLLIDQGKYFAFEVKEVDKVQSDLKLMDEWSNDASEQMSIEVDKDILAAVPSDAHANNAGATAGAISQNINLGVTGTPLVLTKANILDVIVNFGTVLDEQNVPRTNRWIVLPASACGLIKKSDLKDASLTGDNESVLRNGRIGMIDNFRIYNSNNVNKSGSEYDIIAGHKSAITFASQATKMEQIPNQNDFGDLVRGLNIFGHEVIKPESMLHCVASISQ